MPGRRKVGREKKTSQVKERSVFPRHYQDFFCSGCRDSGIPSPLRVPPRARGAGGRLGLWVSALNEANELVDASRVDLRGGGGHGIDADAGGAAARDLVESWLGWGWGL